MATPKQNAAEYPPEFFALFRRAVKAETRLPCETPEKAKSLRTRLYMFREALYAQPDASPFVALIAPYLSFTLDGSDLVAARNPEMVAKLNADIAEYKSTHGRGNML